MRPGQRILVTATIQFGAPGGEYSSTVIVRLNNGPILTYQERGSLNNFQHKYPGATYIDISDREDFDSEEPFPNDDGKVPVLPEKDPARKDNDRNSVATKDLEVQIDDDGKLPAVPT